MSRQGLDRGLAESPSTTAKAAGARNARRDGGNIGRSRAREDHALDLFKNLVPYMVELDPT